MEYVYAAMLLHSAGKEIDDDAVSAVLKAAGVDVDAARVKALVASLSGVDIAEAMATAVAAPAAAAPAAGSRLSLRLKSGLNRTDPIEHVGQLALSVSRVQLRLPKRSTVRGQPRPNIGLGIAGQAVNGPSTASPPFEGRHVAFPAFE